MGERRLTSVQMLMSSAMALLQSAKAVLCCTGLHLPEAFPNLNDKGEALPCPVLLMSLAKCLTE